MRKHWFAAVVLPLVIAMGCSSSDDPAPTTPATAQAPAPPVGIRAEQAPAAAGVTVGATLPTIGTTPKAKPKVELEKTEKPAADVEPEKQPAEVPATPFPDIGDLFAPPKVVIPVVTREPVPEKKQEPTPVAEPKPDDLPPLKLLGFIEVEGLKAMLSVDGHLNVVTMGETVEGIKIIAVEPPSVTLHYDDRNFKIDLFEQPWFHQPDEILGGANMIGGKPVRSNNPLSPSTPGPGNRVPPIPTLPNARSSHYPTPGDSNPNRPGGFPGIKSNDLPSFPSPLGNGAPGLPPLPSIKAPSTEIPGLPKLSPPSSNSGSTAKRSKSGGDHEEDD